MKRVYRAVSSGRVDDGWGVTLDGRTLRTPSKNPLVLPSAALAAAIAGEWDAPQGEIPPPVPGRPAAKAAVPGMPLFRLAATAIDRTAAQRDLITSETANYAGTDLLCYRADHPPALAARQAAAWQPLLDWATQRYDAGLVVTAGIVPARQSPLALQAFAAAVAAQDDFRLTALHALTAACGSLVIALALSEGRLDAAAAFTLSQLDETFQIEAWGEDAEAAARRRALAADIAATARFLELLKA
jgi:chaperone required for assembly of F1-ATPase